VRSRAIVREPGCSTTEQTQTQAGRSSSAPGASCVILHFTTGEVLWPRIPKERPRSTIALKTNTPVARELADELRP
jgi:hypothetical protein